MLMRSSPQSQLLTFRATTLPQEHDSRSARQHTLHKGTNSSRQAHLKRNPVLPALPQLTHADPSSAMQRLLGTCTLQQKGLTSIKTCHPEGALHSGGCAYQHGMLQGAQPEGGTPVRLPICTADVQCRHRGVSVARDLTAPEGASIQAVQWHRLICCALRCDAS